MPINIPIPQALVVLEKAKRLAAIEAEKKVADIVKNIEIASEKQHTSVVVWCCALQCEYLKDRFATFGYGVKRICTIHKKQGVSISWS